MFRINLGRLKFVRKMKLSTSQLLLALSPLTLIASSAYAGYVCNPVQDCRMTWHGDTGTLYCEIKNNCVWYPDPVTPPSQTPTPPPPPPPPTPTYQQCIANAAATGATCRSAYGQLNTICAGFNAYLGGAAAASSKWLYGKIVGSALDDKTEALMIAGAAATGYAIDDSLVPCTSLTGQAMGFCSAGEAKMKSECK